MKNKKDLNINWNIVGTLIIAWIGSLLATLTLKLPMARNAIPLIVLVLVIYFSYATLRWFIEEGREAENEKTQKESLDDK
jgi:hypothetical protein